jgi:hypothetical protein
VHDDHCQTACTATNSRNAFPYLGRRVADDEVYCEMDSGHDTCDRALSSGTARLHVANIYGNEEYPKRVSAHVAHYHSRPSELFRSMSRDPADLQTQRVGATISDRARLPNLRKSAMHQLTCPHCRSNTDRARRRIAHLFLGVLRFATRGSVCAKLSRQHH